MFARVQIDDLGSLVMAFAERDDEIAPVGRFGRREHVPAWNDRTHQQRKERKRSQLSAEIAGHTQNGFLPMQLC